MPAVASAWIGRPFRSMCIVTTAAWVLPDRRVTDVTWPTSTPAIRTGDGMWSWVSLVNTALSTNGEPANGVGPPNVRYTAAAITIAAMTPAARVVTRER